MYTEKENNKRKNPLFFNRKRNFIKKIGKQHKEENKTSSKTKRENINRTLNDKIHEQLI